MCGYLRHLPIVDLFEEKFNIEWLHSERKTASQHSERVHSTGKDEEKIKALVWRVYAMKQNIYISRSS